MGKIEEGFGLLFMMLGLLVILYAINFATLEIVPDDTVLPLIFISFMWFIVLVTFGIGVYTLVSILMALGHVATNYKRG